MKASNIPFKVLTGSKTLYLSIPVEHQVDDIPAYTAEHFANYIERLHPELKGIDYKIRF